MFVSGEELTAYKEALDQFSILFPSFAMDKISDYHVFYFTNTAAIRDIFIKITTITAVSGELYNILVYTLFRKRTIGQRLTSLAVVNINDDERPRFYKLILRSILTPLPFTIITTLVVCCVLNMFGIHKLIIANAISVKILRFLIVISNPVFAGAVIMILLILWFNIYFLTDRLILVDIISKTRVVDVKYIVQKTIIGPDGKKEIAVEVTGNSRFIVRAGDKIISWIEKFDSAVKSKNKQIFEYIRNVIGGK
jgi:hypothetical protein